jgi:hypothetical protein
MQLARVIRLGLDLDGDGPMVTAQPHLDTARIYYGGQSLGSIYGTIMMAVEPSLRAAALTWAEPARSIWRTGARRIADWPRRRWVCA